jgi:hypothetical protein
MAETAITATREEYERRLRAVYRQGEAHCPSLAGRDHAVCVLPPDHPGKDHEGNGYDQWGPKYHRWRTK